VENRETAITRAFGIVWLKAPFVDVDTRYCLAHGCNALCIVPQIIHNLSLPFHHTSARRNVSSNLPIFRVTAICPVPTGCFQKHLVIFYWAMKRNWKTVSVKRDDLFGNETRFSSSFFHRGETCPFSVNGPFQCRIAVHEERIAPPRVILVDETDPRRFMREMCNRSFELAQSLGGVLPRVLFKELLDNLIHAGFQDPVITLSDRGNSLTVGDHGDGISSPEHAIQLGFSTGTRFLRNYIRGVGSGLPLVKEIIEKMGGSLVIDRNLHRGALLRVTLNTTQLDKLEAQGIPSLDQQSFRFTSRPSLSSSFTEDVILSDREKHVLLLLGETETVGPSKVAKELDISLSTAHRDLARLERRSLLQSLPNGKKRLTEKGMGQLELLFSGIQEQEQTVS